MFIKSELYLKISLKYSKWDIMGKGIIISGDEECERIQNNLFF